MAVFEPHKTNEADALEEGQPLVPTTAKPPAMNGTFPRAPHVDAETQWQEEWANSRIELRNGPTATLMVLQALGSIAIGVACVVHVLTTLSRVTDPKMEACQHKWALWLLVFGATLGGLAILNVVPLALVRCVHEPSTRRVYCLVQCLLYFCEIVLHLAGLFCFGWLMYGCYNFWSIDPLHKFAHPHCKKMHNFGYYICEASVIWFWIGVCFAQWKSKSFYGSPEDDKWAYIGEGEDAL